MRKVNLLSKAELKKVTGGGDDPQSFCVPQVHCNDENWNLISKIDVGSCDAQPIWVVCMGLPYDGNRSFCTSCD